MVSQYAGDLNFHSALELVLTALFASIFIFIRNSPNMYKLDLSHPHEFSVFAFSAFSCSMICLLQLK